MYGAAGAVAAAAISGMMVAAIVGRTSNRYALARLSQEVVDLRRRGAVEVAKAERFGAASLVKSLAPALDAMDAAAEHATADAEGIRLTRSTLLAASLSIAATASFALAVAVFDLPATPCMAWMTFSIGPRIPPRPGMLDSEPLMSLFSDFTSDFCSSC